MMRFAELAAPYFETAEIIELHHDQKVDAPSGTALATAERMAAASGALGARSDPLGGGGRGPRRPQPRRHPHPLGAPARAGGPPGGAAGHDRPDADHPPRLLDRSSFMPGVVLAVKKVADRPGLTLGLDALLDL